MVQHISERYCVCFLNLEKRLHSFECHVSVSHIHCGSVPLLARTLTLGLVLLVVPFLPASNIFFRVGFVIAERVLYLSSAGYCLLLAYSLGHCCCRWTKYRVGLKHVNETHFSSSF